MEEYLEIKSKKNKISKNTISNENPSSEVKIRRSTFIPRLHLFEFEDLSWLPVLFRNYLTDFLNHIAVKLDFYQPLVPVLKNKLNRYPAPRIVDLGSGGGGGMKELYHRLKEDLTDLDIVLTDLYPNISAFQKLKIESQGGIDYVESPVDATHVPKHLTGFRTMFRSFHHLKPNMCRAVLGDAVAQREPIGIFEIQERSLAFVIFFIISSPLLVLLFTPFIKPFSLKRLFFTYIIPVVPFLSFWDGTITVLRTYTLREMHQMAQSVPDSDTYHWEVKKIGKGAKIILYLIGYPKA